MRQVLKAASMNTQKQKLQHIEKNIVETFSAIDDMFITYLVSFFRFIGNMKKFRFCIVVGSFLKERVNYRHSFSSVFFPINLKSPENFPILFGFDASKGISCSESSVAGNFERNFHFRNFRNFHRWSIGGPPVGKPPCNLIFPHRWPPVVHRWPVVGYHGLSVREKIIQIS